jgi:hypothetical protein
LNAIASVPGEFIYIPGAGDVLTIGNHRLSVTFIPADTEKYLAAQATVTLVVDGLPNIDSLPAPPAQAPIKPGGAANYMGLEDAAQVAIHPPAMPGLSSKPETRNYKGATYEKGEDGQWHLQQK